ncbi:transporter [Adhaeribacter aerolatus]|uniref:Transporter n=1 Tax=Adhaeribacter aerolatus TaxID=670289 RepID=A0A512AZX9_9BACT|nr:TolC family protein [Adhaeribacter aerolatus]GEO05273.1 transporter [Adhaeribacter aerolatus]
MKVKLLILTWVLSAAGIYPVAAQGTTGTQPFSLQEAIQYALENQPAMKNAELQTQAAKARVGQIRSMGLPQVNAGVDVTDNFKIQKNLVDVSAFGGGGQQQVTITPQNLGQLNNGQNVVLVPEFVPSTEPVQPIYSAFAFGLQYAGAAAISGNQLLFDGSYLIGLKAAKVYTDLARKQVEQTERDIIENVSKAYYGVLVTRERIGLLDQNLVRLERILRETTEINKQGFAEKIDVDRLQVSYNNLKVEKDKANRLLALSIDLLKFQMSLDQNQAIELTDKLDNVVVDAKQVAVTNFDYGQRVEYAILETQRDLALLDVKNKVAGYYPKLFLTGRYGINGGSRNFSDLMELRTKDMGPNYRGPDFPNWFSFGSVGLSLQVPIFDGLRKKYEVQQARIAVETANNGFKILKQSIDLQMRQSNTILQNALQVLESQKQSLELAQEVARVANIKFQEGVGSNLEVVTAETELRQAQTNYYGAVYDAIIAKVDLQKANGTLTK